MSKSFTGLALTAVLFAAGCGRRETFVVICPQYGDGCFAAGPGRFHDWQ